MSQVTDIYEKLLAKIKEQLPSHSQLPNPYKPEENNEQQLRKGFGLQIAGGRNTNRSVNCQLSVARSFNLVITRQVRANEMDYVGKDSSIKAILDDQALIIKMLEREPSLGLDGIGNANFTDDGGLEFVFNEKDNYVKIVSTITVEHFENL